MITITNIHKGKLPRLPFDVIKNKVLGKKYSLSLVFIGSGRSQMLNKRYRGKDKPADVLSFPFSKTDGEIFIDPDHARTKAPLHDKTFRAYIGFLFIHGLLHLKGFDHGSTMEREEKKYCRFFSL